MTSVCWFCAEADRKHGDSSKVAAAAAADDDDDDEMAASQAEWHHDCIGQ